jgi:hypothetical protein
LRRAEELHDHGRAAAAALTANPGLTIAVFTAEPGSKSEQALNLLASWTATHEQPESAFTRLHG